MTAMYYGRMLDAVTGGEGKYEFEGPSDLMQRTADEIVSRFFETIEDEMPGQPIDWEINHVFKNSDRRMVVATGSLIHKQEEPSPYLLLIADQK
jgi:hypothetical protein